MIQGQLKGVENDEENLSSTSSSNLMAYFQKGFSRHKIKSHQVALKYQGKSHSFDDLHKISDQIAQLLKKKVAVHDGNWHDGIKVNGDGGGDLVIGICLPPSDKLIFILFAILKLGGAYMPLDPCGPVDRIKNVLKLAKPPLVIIDISASQQTREKFDNSQVLTVQEIWNEIGQIQSIRYYGEIRENGRENHFQIFQQNQETKIAAILFTSGTTGEPKGVRLSHKTILNRLHWQWSEFPFGPQENCCLKTALTFVDSIPEIFGPLLQGHSLIIFDRREVTQPHIFGQRILEHQISQLILVPSLLRALLSTMDMIDQRGHQQQHCKLRPLDSVKLWICSGEPLTYDLIQQFFTYFGHRDGMKLCNFYGSTEIMDVTFHVFRSMDDVHGTIDETGSKVNASNKIIPLGSPLWNTTIYVLNSDLQMTEDGEVGEIFVAGLHVGSGYVGQGQSDRYLTISGHHDGSSSTLEFGEESELRLYRTGDFGWIQRWQNDKILFYGGRTDSQVKVRGHRVDMGEIQAAICEIDIIQTAVVLCYQREEPQQLIVAFVVLATEDDDENVVKKIIKILTSKLLDYQMPLVSIVPKIPLLVHGKTDQQKLLHDFHQRRLREINLDENNNADDWPKKNLAGTNENVSRVKILFSTISKFTGTPASDLRLTDSFYAIGGTSINSITVLTHLKTLNYYISIENFVSAQTIGELLQCMEPLDHQCDHLEVNMTRMMEDQKLSFEPLNPSHKADVVGIFSAGFAHKGDLEVYAQLSYADLEREISALWHPILEAGYSFVSRRHHDNKVVGVCLNLDDQDKPKDDTECSAGTLKIWEFLENIGKSFRATLTQGKGQILYCYIVATHRELTEAENFLMIHSLERENVRRAQGHNFQAIITENTNLLTQKMATDVLGYEEVCSVQINEYQDPKTGSKPFIFAPDDQRVTVCYKKIGDNGSGGNI